jgi:hypothetical protein
MQRWLRSCLVRCLVVRNGVCSEALRHTGTTAERKPQMSTRSASIDLPPHATSVPAARHLLLELLRVWDVPHDREDAALLVTELGANVVAPVGGEANLTLEFATSEDWLRISVADGSSIRPVVRELSKDRPRGRGLRLVQAIAHRWGSEDHHGGKRVWFEMVPPTR